jgi:gliding motility-associated-like protein
VFVIPINLLFLGMQKCYLYLILLFIIATTPLKASHIVGGEFQLKVKRGYNYELILRMYYDDINASPDLLYADLSIDVAIYKKNDPYFPPIIFKLKRDPDIGFIQYNYNNCTDFNQNYVRTRLFTYTKDIYLDPAIYNDPGGYYVVWERCCRNKVISNIQNPDNTGNAFYLEFPPVVDIAGNRFENTSPLFDPITGDFPCLGQPFTFPFGAFDPDGDFLTYTLVTPFAGWSGPGPYNNPLPDPPDPAPYPPIQWNPGYGTGNEIPGSPPLTVDASGVLHVTPSLQGLYAIALRVDEYRNGVKIGSVRRDFQFFVINCPVKHPGPIIGIAKPGGSVFSQHDTLNFRVERDTCLSILISDKSDTLRNISISSIKTNLPSSIITIQRSFQAKLGDTLKTPMCFDACRKLDINQDSMFFIEIVVEDQQCPTPKTDTLKFTVLYKPQVNAKPKISLDTVSSPFTRQVLIGDLVKFNVIGTDSDSSDIITLSGSGVGFNLSDYDMSFSTVRGSDSIVAPFSWRVPCKALDPGAFKLEFILNDNSCIVSHSDTISLTFYVRDTVSNIEKFEPPNLVTPNGDQKNDYFQLVNLPVDNCLSYFAGVFIYNRWGAKVFESYKRDFMWDPAVFSDGLYYYMIDFHSTKVKGWLQIIK